MGAGRLLGPHREAATLVSVEPGRGKRDSGIGLDDANGGLMTDDDKGSEG